MSGKRKTSDDRAMEEMSEGIDYVDKKDRTAARPEKERKPLTATLGEIMKSKKERNR